MTGNDDIRDLGDIVTQCLEDNENLKKQIRHLLKTMDVVESMAHAPILTLPDCREGNDDGPPETRMEWKSSRDSKMQKKGKTMPVSAPPKFRDPVDKFDEDLSALDIMELCINEKIEQFIPVSDSAFFVPILNRCVFGVTLLNVTNTKLKMPKISLSLVTSPSETDTFQPKRDLVCRCFTYEAQVNLKETKLERIDLIKTNEGCIHQDIFSNYMDGNQDVMPGCEVLVTTSFSYPHKFLNYSPDFTIILSAYLEEKELWTREIPITDKCFKTATIDEVFKRHQTSILAALGKEYEVFKVERLLSQSDLVPYKSMERFLMPLGYENIQTIRIGIDTVIEVFTTNQPSMLWGSCFKIEKCSKKPSVIRCLVTSSSREQMQYLFTQLRFWLENEGKKDRKHGFTGISISHLNPTSNSNICEKLQAEVDLILKFQKIKIALSKQRETGGAFRRKMDTRNDLSIDSDWIHEYSICVERTDYAFAEKMN